MVAFFRMKSFLATRAVARLVVLLAIVVTLPMGCSDGPLDNIPKPNVLPNPTGNVGNWTWKKNAGSGREYIGLEVTGRRQSSPLSNLVLGLLCFTDDREIAVGIDWGIPIAVAYHQRAVVNINGYLVWDRDNPLRMESFSSPNSDITFVSDSQETQLIERLHALGDEIAFMWILVDRHPLDDRPFKDESGVDLLLEGTGTAIENWFALCTEK